MQNIGPVHTNAFSFENAYFFIRFRLPSTLIRSKTEVYVCENRGFRKRSLEWRFLKTEVQRLCVGVENGGSASLCGRAKTEGFENDYVNDIGMCQLKKQNGCFLMRFRWSSVDGRKRCKNASVDEKLFIRFQETENGGFRKRISVDRAIVTTLFGMPCFHRTRNFTFPLRFPQQFLAIFLRLVGILSFGYTVI